MTPTISLDTNVVLHESIEDGTQHAKRLNSALSKLLDSIASDGGFKVIHGDTNSQYSIFLVLGKSDSESKKFTGNSLKAFIKDNYNKNVVEDFGCEVSSLDNFFCFAYDQEMEDSTNYHYLSKNISFGSKLRYFVPMNRVLIPKNASNKKTFSINDFIRTENESNRKVAINLTHLINNILVYNQPEYPRKVFSRPTEYVYFNNYLSRRKRHKKSEFIINANLKDDINGKLILSFNFQGKNVNLIAPEPLTTIVSLNKNRLLAGDYSEAMLIIYPLLREFILMNTLFDN
ncbi:MAG: hypothetical protein WAZ98_14945 [Cyclobacteriaceae bacterium]